LVQGVFDQSFYFPVYFIGTVLIVLSMAPIDAFLYGMSRMNKEKREEDDSLRLYRENIAKASLIEPSQLAPIKKHHGFAFSGEAGHTPQITNKLTLGTRRILQTHHVLQAIRK